MKALQFKNELKQAALIIVCLLIPMFFVGQGVVKDFSDERVLWEPFWPWDSSVLTNDSLRVDISSDFSAEEKQSIKDAMDRWNDAGGKPPMKVDGSDAPVKVNKGSLPAGTPGKTVQKDSDNDGKAESAEVTLDPSQCTTISLKEVATHEFGHVLGLGHTEGAADVMKPEGTNGTDGALSDHDKSELNTVKDQYAMSFPRDGAEFPFAAIIPGDTSVISFDLSAYYPPEILPLVIGNASPYFDDNLFVVHSSVYNTSLNVEVYPTFNHWPGTFYLMVHLLPPAPYEPMNFLGYFYINESPVPHVAFECPFEITEENGEVYVNWAEFCTYPFPNQLNSVLMVDGTNKYSPKNGRNYVIEIEPGTHLFELYVDDFQVNSAYSSQSFLVTGYSYHNYPIPFTVSPNPFTISCAIRSERDLNIFIFDNMGRMKKSFTGKSLIWTPSPGDAQGIYYVVATDGVHQYVEKIVYLK